MIKSFSSSKLRDKDRGQTDCHMRETSNKGDLIRMISLILPLKSAGRILGRRRIK